MRRWRSRPLACLVAFALMGCATTTPYVGQGPHPQIERGQAIPPLDALANLLAVIPKLLLWDWRFANHAISADTEQYLVTYLGQETPLVPALADTKVRLNQYRPVQDLSRLIHNRYVAWPYRLVLGLPSTLIFDVLLPGRLFPWGDYYNPWTNTVHLYSDHPAIALHEAGHAHDFGHRRFKGTYAAARIIPFVDLYQEFQATDEAIRYFVETGDQRQELRAYKILYPAMGTYAGQYMFIFGGTIIGALVGHAFGRAKAHDRAKYYQARAVTLPSSSGPTTSPPLTTPVTVPATP